ncbi:Flp family type IVb pilin [Mariniblastus sp.]|nr:Flp family type IVb pilin [Mariniblastus sp.]
MKKFMSQVQRFMESEDGPTAVEYAVMLALIIVVCLVAIGKVGTTAASSFETINDRLQVVNP